MSGRPLHIVLVSPAWPVGFPNGIVTYVHHLRAGLQDQGHRVSCLVFMGADGRTAEGVYPLRPDWRTLLGKKLRWLARRPPTPHAEAARTVADSVLRLHRTHPVDIVEMEESYGWFAEVQRRLPMPVVVKLHGPAFLSLVDDELEQPESLARIEWEGRALRAAHHVTSPSLDTLQRTRGRYDLSAHWGLVIANAIAMDEQAPRWTRAAADPATLLFVGRFDRRKGGDLLIIAFGQLLQARPDLQLVFVGPDPGVVDGAGGTVQIDDFIRAVLPEHQRSQVRVTGQLGPTEIARLRCQAAITLVCSRWENQPNTALEALLQGCPVVGFDAGGMAEVVEHGVSGRLARRGDIDDFCQQVLWLLDHPAEAEEYGQRGRAHVLQVHGVAAVATRTAAYYQQVLKATPPPQGH